MSDEHPATPFEDIEPERYELEGPPSYRFDVDRRDFLRLTGGGLVVLVGLGTTAGAQESGGGRRPEGAASLPEELSAWLHIGEDGAVTVFTGKVEVGQGIRTSLAQAVADELRVGIDRVRLVMGDTDRTPYDRGTFGSRSTPDMGSRLRKAAATARAMLVERAAARWAVDPASLVVEAGAVVDPATGRRASFGALAGGGKLVGSVRENAPVTPPSRWSLAGRAVRDVRGPDLVTGRHRFVSDLARPGQWYGKVLRPPSIGARLVDVDLAEAEAIPDVVVVRDGSFVGVAAPSVRLAERALAAIRARWEPASMPSSEEIFEHLRTHPAAVRGWRGPRRSVRGSVPEALAAADVVVEETYTVATIAHVPLEPRAAVAEWTDGRLTVWTGTQRPFGVRDELAEVFHLPSGRVRVLVPDTGSAYGGKHTGECAVEAARLARAAGRPVRLVWTREEEMTWAYFRPAGVIDVRSGARRDGRLLAWELHNYNSGAAGIASRYDVANEHLEFHPAEAPLRQGSYRALAATANHFARESHIDAVGHRVGLDPLVFRSRNTSDPRFVAVLEAAAERFGWARRERTPGRGFGLAAGFEKGAYVATCAEVVVEEPGRRVRVERLVTAFDCGAVVNPDGLRNQIEGSVIMGLGGALFEAVEHDRTGRIRNAALSSYRVPRFSDVPRLETVLVDRKDVASAGAGETPIVCVAPAIGNAIFDATGVRLRSLPMIPSGTVV